MHSVQVLIYCTVLAATSQLVTLTLLLRLSTDFDNLELEW